MIPRYCENLKAIRYESTSFNRIVADKSHHIIAALHFRNHHSLYPGCLKIFLKYGEHCIDDFKSIRYCVEKELCVPRFLAIILVFYIVDGLKGDLIICLM